MDFVDDGFICGDLVRSVFFVPFDPFAPLLDDLLSIELSGNRKPGDRINVGVKIFSFLAMLIFLSKDLFDLMLI